MHVCGGRIGLQMISTLQVCERVLRASLAGVSAGSSWGHSSRPWWAQMCMHSVANLQQALVNSAGSSTADVMHRKHSTCVSHMLHSSDIS
jgi:hypothetical protein